MVPFKRDSTLLVNLLKAVHFKEQIGIMTDLVFEHLDEDNSGALDTEEIGRVMTMVALELDVSPPTQDDLTSIFSVIDEDGSGEVDKEEFQRLVMIIL